MSCKTTRVKRHGKDHLDTYRRKAWEDKYRCRREVTHGQAQEEEEVLNDPRNFFAGDPSSPRSGGQQ